MILASVKRSVVIMLAEERRGRKKNERFIGNVLLVALVNWCTTNLDVVEWRLRSKKFHCGRELV